MVEVECPDEFVPVGGCAMRRTGWLVVAVLLGLAVPLLAQDRGPGSEPLDPERTSSGSAPFDPNTLGKYSDAMLEAFLDAFQKTQTDEAQEIAKKITAYLSTRNPAGGGANGSSGSGSGGSGRTDRPTPASSPATAAGPRPGTGTAPGSSQNRPGTASDDWFARAVRQMSDFWASDSGQPPAGSLKKGQIYDPRTGKIVDLDEHTTKVGLSQSFDDELANTQSGSGGEMRRLGGK
jgi:hypothetical protein